MRDDGRHSNKTASTTTLYPPSNLTPPQNTTITHIAHAKNRHHEGQINPPLFTRPLTKHNTHPPHTGITKGKSKFEIPPEWRSMRRVPKQENVRRACLSVCLCVSVYMYMKEN